jgi:exosortase D (VPLPA-CTERM-specific)
MTTSPGSIDQPLRQAPWLRVGVCLLVALTVAIVFRDGTRDMVATWGEAEYSHGWLIPFISLYLLSIRLGALESARVSESWWGVLLLFAGLMGYVFGELSALFVLVQYSLVLTLWGVALTAVGGRGVRIIWPALVFLLFMVPLPRFIQWNLTNELQLLSSQFGGQILRLMGIPVYLEGNVIDLGNYKLQVVEACAGLRYLFPLMCFGLLSAVLFKGRVWQKVVLFVSSAPIALLMNSVRIAVTGVLVNRFGTEAAEGFLHYFEGWVIFSACLLLMFLEMHLLARASGKPLSEVFDVDLPGVADVDAVRNWRPAGRPLLAAVALLMVFSGVSLVLKDRQENLPAHPALSTFPLVIGEWRGKESSLGSQELEVLQLTDYVMASYDKPGVQSPVELYVAYYESQRKGASVHSPKACLPGGGWKIDQSSEYVIPGLAPDGSGVPVNRTLISMGEQRLLVYYWFMQRGRNLTNEYLVKWYIFWDSITMRRTDGALVRLLTPLAEDEEPEAGDRRLTGFLKDAEPRLYYHIPQADAVPSGEPPAGPLLSGRP